MKESRRKLIAPATVVLAILLLLAGWLALQPSGNHEGQASGAARPVEEPRVHRFGPPDEWFVAGAMAKTYADTLSGVDLRTGETSVYVGRSPPSGPYLVWYVVGRAYPSWDTSVLPDDAEVLSATLVLELPAGGGREIALEIAVYQGTWTPPIGLEDWLSPGDEDVGRWRLPASRVEEREKVHTGQGITLYAPEPARTVRVALDPGVVEVDGITRLELRHAGEGAPPNTAGLVSLGPSQITLEVEYRP